MTPISADDKQVGLDAHVEQARDGADAVVGVQGRQHQVPGQRRLHRDLGGLLLADLADHDDVRVLSQDVLQDLREGEADARRAPGSA